jgi:hypothetical protein
VKEGPLTNRKAIAIVAFAAAGVTLVAMLAALSSGFAWRLPVSAIPVQIFGPNSRAIAFGPAQSGTKTLPAAGVHSVQIDAPVGSVSLTATATDTINLHWTVAGKPASALSTVLQGGVLEVQFQPPRNVVNIGSEPDHLDVVIPSDLAATAQVDAGAMTVQGNFQSLNVTLQAGALNVQNFRGALTAHDSMGTINVQQATVTGPLSLTANMGAITFTGDPGLAATVQADMGAISLAVAPHGRLRVQGSVQMGQFSSGFAGVGRTGGHSFGGTIGSGKPGYLTVTDQMGPVSIDQY